MQWTNNLCYEPFLKIGINFDMYLKYINGYLGVIQIEI
jgi:hypothetical protein